MIIITYSCMGNLLHGDGLVVNPCKLEAMKASINPGDEYIVRQIEKVNIIHWIWNTLLLQLSENMTVS